MSKVPAILRNKLMQLAIGFAAGTSAYMSVQAPSHQVQLAMELGAHYESSGRHIGAPYVDKLGKGQPLTVCNGVTGPEVQLGKYYTKDDCQRLELPRYLDAEKAAKRIFKHWSQYNVWVRASFIDMIYNLGESAVAASSMVRLANAGDLPAACAQMPRWVRGTVNGQSVPLPGLIDRRATTQELCRDWGRDGHFTAALVVYSMHPFKNKCGWLALLLLPLAMLVGCASNSVKPTNGLPQLPLPPSATTPQPQTSYSDSAATDTQSWLQELMATPLMQESAGQLGRAMP